jgi:hypothetical protein
MTRRRRFATLLPLVLAGCGSGGRNPYSLEVGADDAGQSFVSGGDDAGVSAFDAHIERNHVAVSVTSTW